jgi:glycosyltransferase involved in cell wall biosynthesis
MKLLIVSHSCTVPISQQFYAEIEQRTGWDLTIVIPALWNDEYGNQLSPQRWSSYRGKLIGIPVWKSGNIPLHTYRSWFVKLLRELEPDFIYLHQEPYAIVTLQVYLANRFTIQKPTSFFTWQNILKRYPTPFRQMERWVFKQTNVMFPGSYGADAVMRQKGYSGKSVLLPSGVDPAIYYPRSDAASLKQDLVQSDHEVLIGYVGRIVEQKGLKTLLFALQDIRELPWRLVMVGSGGYETELDGMARSLNLTDRIQRIGYIPNPETPRYLSAFDLLVLPSETRANWKEQFGRVIIESMACQTPVIGSDSGEIPNLIQATQGGLVFAEGQPTELADRLRQLILNPDLRLKLAKTGQQSILQNYTNDRLAQRFIETVENIVQLHQQKRALV